MPLYEYQCSDCGILTEVLLVKSDDIPVCSACNSTNMVKQMSAHSSLPASGGTSRMPGPGDTACCGSAPGQASGCAGPGSCCGKQF